jgi:SpoVK/Ycf46/Vps4 family AAA+-type ATPase
MPDRRAISASCARCSTPTSNSTARGAGVSGHHHDRDHQHEGPLAPGNLLTCGELRAEYGEQIIETSHRSLLEELAAIAEHQWRSNIRRGLIKGFFLSGPPGTGKTTLAKRLAIELGRRFAGDGETAVVMGLVDGSEIARSRYGESEARIRDIFAHARSGFTAAGQRTVLLFDDVESILMARGNENAKEWHFSQDSVFFHAVDDLDTSRAIVVLTSNRPDLVDDAIRDRFLEYRIEYPDVTQLAELAASLADRQRFGPAEKRTLDSELRAAVAAGTVRSLRDAERFVVRLYVRAVLR